MQRIVPDPSLALFAKLPRPGAVKTRLIPELGEAAATDLYKAMLADGIARLRRFDDRSRKAEIWWSSPPHAAPRERLEETNITEHVQSGGNLGDRMATAVRHALHSGRPAGVVLGVDAPTLPDERILRLDGVVRHEVLSLSTVDNVEQGGSGVVRFDWLMQYPPATPDEARAVRAAAPLVAEARRRSS